jgi:DNA polymerase III subunit beta
VKLTMAPGRLTAATGWVTATARPARNPQSPVLAGILLTATADGTVTVAGTDWQTSATARASADVGEPGRVLIPARMLAPVLAALPARQPVEVAFDGTRLIITAGAVRYTLLALPDGDYAELPAPGEHAAEFDAKALAAAVAHVAAAAGKDDTLPVLTCVRLTLDGGTGTATLAATDRYRLAVLTCPYAPGPADATGDALIPARDLAAIIKRPGDGPVRLALTGETAAFSTANRHVTMRLVCGEFPDVTRHIPDSAAVTTTVTAEVAPLAAALKRAAVVADRDTPARLAVTDGSVTVESGTSDDASYTETVPAALDGEPLTIAFNPGYLLDGLAAVTGTGSTAARLAMTTPGKPAVITPAAPTGPTGLTYVLMPVKHAG